MCIRDRLISFIIHQYYQLGDALVQTFNQAVTSAVNDCENKIKESLFENRMNTSRLVSSVAVRSVTHIDVLTEVERIIHDQVLEASRKVELIDELPVSYTHLDVYKRQLFCLWTGFSNGSGIRI